MMRIALTTAALAMAPSAAMAVTVSSGSGSGTQYRTTSYANGAKVTGTLKASGGNTVYYSGKVALGNLCSDINTTRYSTNTSSNTAVTRGGSISTIWSGTCSFQGVKSRVCRVINTVPDACGSDSKTY